MRWKAFYAAFRREFSLRIGFTDDKQLSMYSPLVTKREAPTRSPATGWKRELPPVTDISEGARSTKVQQRLSDFIDVFNGYREFRLLVEGHTHSRGNSRQKLLATKTQAERVTERIRSSVSQAQVSSLGRGDDAPLGAQCRLCT